MKIVRAALAAVEAHAAEGYPYEVCGFLIGPLGRRRITEARRAGNLVTERARDRYEIDPRDHIRVQKECDSKGLEVVGYYHSHPDHPAQASVFDAERAWAGPLYLIVSVSRGRVAERGAFVAERDGGPFRAEELEAV